MASTDAQVTGLDTSRIEITVKGTLTVNATGSAPAVFEADTGAAKGTWYGIVIEDATSSVAMHFAIVRHAITCIFKNRSL